MIAHFRLVRVVAGFVLLGALPALDGAEGGGAMEGGPMPAEAPATIRALGLGWEGRAGSGDQRSLGTCRGGLASRRTNLLGKWDSRTDRLRGGLSVGRAEGQLTVWAGTLLPRFGDELFTRIEDPSLHRVRELAPSIAISTRAGDDDEPPEIGFGFSCRRKALSLAFLGAVGAGPTRKHLSASMALAAGSSERLRLLVGYVQHPRSGPGAGTDPAPEGRASLAVLRASRRLRLSIEGAGGPRQELSHAASLETRASAGRLSLSILHVPAGAAGADSTSAHSGELRGAGTLQGFAEIRLPWGAGRWLTLNHGVGRVPDGRHPPLSRSWSETSVVGTWRSGKWRGKVALAGRQEIKSGSSLALGERELDILFTREWRHAHGERNLGLRLKAVLPRDPSRPRGSKDVRGCLSALTLSSSSRDFRIRGAVQAFTPPSAGGALSIYEGGVPGGHTHRIARSGTSGWLVLQRLFHRGDRVFSVGASATRLGDSTWEPRWGLCWEISSGSPR